MESALRDAAHDPELRLIETALWTGADCARLERHIARLMSGAEALGWRVAPPLAAFRGPEGQPARLRILLGRDGTALTEVGAVPEPVPLWRVEIAALPLRSSDPWLRIKSTRREAYDAARNSLSAEADEAILVNERDEICDGSITTVFFDRGDGLCTPPLASGVLPGVLRAEMIVQGTREEVLPLHDLPHVRLWLGNALRGLSPARLLRGADSPSRFDP